MPEIINPDNQIFCNDPTLEPIVQKLADKLCNTGFHLDNLGIFRSLLETRNNPEENYKEIKKIINTIIPIYRFSIDKLLNGQNIKIGREMIVHMSLSKLNFPIANR